MKRLVMKEYYDDDVYAHDVDRIIRVCYNAGFLISKPVAYDVWEKYSDSMAAGWMLLPEQDSHLLEIVQQYTDEVDEYSFRKF